MPYQLPMEKMHAEKVHKLLQINVLRGMIYNSPWKLLEGGMERGCLWQNDHGVPVTPVTPLFEYSNIILLFFCWKSHQTTRASYS